MGLTYKALRSTSTEESISHPFFLGYVPGQKRCDKQQKSMHPSARCTLPHLKPHSEHQSMMDGVER
eukprot:scaffold19172_cov78-Skeletonema_dohrnii-CCMP3373.AAC.1